MSDKKTWKRELVEDIVVVAVVLFVVWSSGIGLQLYLRTPTPLLAVESGSMEPVLYRGDLVVVRAVDPTTLRVGDIVIYDAASLRYSQSDVPIVHRIVEIQNVAGELLFFTKGDNNPGRDDGNRTASDIIAKVIGSVRYLGFITLLLLSSCSSHLSPRPRGAAGPALTRHLGRSWGLFEPVSNQFRLWVIVPDLRQTAA